MHRLLHVLLLALLVCLSLAGYPAFAYDVRFCATVDVDLDDWDPDDASPNTDGLRDDPIERMEDAADDLGYGAEHDVQKDNGLDH